MTKYGLKSKRFIGAIVFFFLLSALCFSTEVTQERAHRVAQNYLHHYLSVYGNWADSDSPMITECELAMYKGKIVAYNFKVYPKGHILVPYWDEFSPVLMYSTTSEFTPSRAEQIGSIESWILPEIYQIYQGIEKIRADIEKDIIYEETRVAKAWEWLDQNDRNFSPFAEDIDYRFATVGPLLTTTWDQPSPYNQYCPGISGLCTHCVAGCVAIAWSQLMKYWDWPDRGTGSHSYYWAAGGQTLSANFDHDYYWSQMPNNLTASSTSAQKDAVARLVSDVGISADMDYGCGSSGSGAWANDVLDVYFKYKSTMVLRTRGSYTAAQWFNYFRTELDASPPRPVIFSIFATTGGGHEVVADGYQTGATDKVHINFGWSGNYNGFYDVTNNFTANYTWRWDNQVIVTNIEPDITTTASASVTSLWPVPDTSPGGNATLWAEVQNTGSSALPSDAKVWFQVEGPGFSDWVGSTSCSGLGSGATQWYSYIWTVPSGATPGSYTYKARVYTSSGPISDLSTGQSFNIIVIAPPGQATLVSPSGTISDTTPTYTWNAVSNATWYYLWVNGPSGNVIQQWYRASDVTSGTTCSATPSTTLATGAHTWWVRTWNSYGYGPWSSGMSFTVSASLPGQATLLSPSGSISDTTPTYTWNAVSNATWYYLWVNGPSGNVIQQWYKAADVTSGTTCSATPSTTLATGAHTWWVRTWNSIGYGPWSSAMSFTVTAGGGFNSQFNGDMTGWDVHSGSWSIANNQWLTTQGIVDYFSSVSYADTFSDFDYRTRIWNTDDAIIWLMARGNPNPLSDDYDWDSAYCFGYDLLYGDYCVLKSTGGSSWTVLQSWTDTSALIYGDWNECRIVANGSNLYFYINGTLVWSGTDSDLTSGRVGIEMYPYTSSDQIWVDWATLTEGATDIQDKVSEEQQALNEEANKRGEGAKRKR